jgi:hypothetical protein
METNNKQQPTTPKVDKAALQASIKAHETAVNNNQIVTKNEQANHSARPKG